MIDQDRLIQHLDAIDTKCAALLQLSGIVLTIGSLPALAGNVSGVQLVISSAIAVIFLTICLVSLSVLWYVPEPDEAVFHRRSRLYKFCVCLTACGLILIGVLFAVTLLRTM